MQRLILIRYAVLILMRDLLVPGTALYILAVNPGFSACAPYTYPILAGMVGTPLIGRNSGPPSPAEEDEG